MPKHCDVCKKPYADDLEECPHCASAFEAFAEESEAEMTLDVPAETGGRKAPAGSAAAETEDIDWANLEAAAEDSAVRFEADAVAAESPSDIGLTGPEEAPEELPVPKAAGPAEGGDVRRGQRAPATMLATPEETELPTAAEAGPRSRPGAQGSSAEVDLGEPATVDAPSGVDLLAEANAAGGSMGRSTQEFPPVTSADAEEDAAQSLLDDIHDAPTRADEDSAVDLGAEPEEEREEEPEEAPARPARPGRESFSELEVDLENLGEPPITATDDMEARLEETETELRSEAIAAPEEEEEVEEEVPARRRIPWVGGTVGALLGSGVTVAGLWLGGLLGGGAPAGAAAARQAPPPPPPLPAISAADHVKMGEFDKALPLLESGGEDGDTVALRGEVRWLSHLRQARQAKAPLKADDEAIKQATDDLTKANTPRAVFWLGQIREQLGDVAGARKTYQEALKTYGQDPAQQRLFQGALDRLDARAAQPAAAPAQSSRIPAAELDAVLALVLTALQAEPPAPMEAAAETEPVEAGFAFWRAAKLARAGNYAAAVKELQAARQAHEQRRFLVLRKAQNPDSDPNEEIFLRCCDELLTYWQLANEVRAGTPVAQADVGAAVKALVAQRKQLADTLDALLEKLKKEPSVKEPQDVAKALDQLLQAKMLADKQLSELDDMLKTSRKASEDAMMATKMVQEKLQTAEQQLTAAKTQLADVQSRLVTAGVKQADVVKGVSELAASKADADKALADVTRQLQDGKYLDPKADRTQLLAGLQRALELARTVDPAGKLTEVQNELRRHQGMLSQRHTPQQMLAIWLPLLASRDKDAATRAEHDAGRVLSDESATPAARAEALCVRGLAQRNQGKYAEARTSLEQALQGAGKATGSWQKLASETLKELTDPTAYHLPRAESLRALGQLEAARAVLQDGASMFPKDGRLLALRSLVQLDLARQKAEGKLTADDAQVAAAAKDAEAAVAAGAVAEGNYAAGRIAEEVGNFGEARKRYRQAVEAHPGDDPAGHRYRLALARVLLKSPSPRPAATPAPEPARTERAPQAAPPVGRLDAALVATLLFLLGADDGQAAAPPVNPDVDEAIKLADQAIAARNYEGYLIKARALAQKGLWTEALQQYVEGLRKLIPADYAEGLDFLVDNHPAFKRPDSLQPPDPLVADHHYAVGLMLYNQRRYAQAEKEFFEAVRYNDQDARYLYYLGLARLQQGKRDSAFEDFRVASRLEQQSRPSRAAVSAALERVQGGSRRTLNEFRP